MIDEITGISEYLRVNKCSGHKPFINHNLVLLNQQPNNLYQNSPLAGSIRYHNSKLEIYDGTNWTLLDGDSAYVDLSTEGQRIMDWAAAKMKEESRYEKLAELHPGVRELVDNFKLAKERLDLFIALLKKD